MFSQFFFLYDGYHLELLLNDKIIKLWHALKNAQSCHTVPMLLSTEVKKSRSFASTLKRKFQRSKKTRSQSADRASSMREGSLLRPPNQQHHLQAGSRTAGQSQTVGLMVDPAFRLHPGWEAIFLSLYPDRPIKDSCRQFSSSHVIEALKLDMS